MAANEEYLRTVVERKACGRHRAEWGKPCWVVLAEDGSVYWGICDFRARKAGMVGEIDPRSLNQKGDRGSKTHSPRRNLVKSKKKVVSHNNRRMEKRNG